MRQTIFTIAAMVATLGSTSAVQAADGNENKPPVCTTQTAAGTYSVVCTGYFTDASGAHVPVHQVGLATGDSAGNFTGFTTVHQGSIVVPAPEVFTAAVTGKATIATDCTGAITYNKGTPAELNIVFVVNPAASEIRGLVIDPGRVISCQLKKMTK